MSAGGLPPEIYSGPWRAGHVQGAAVDAERKFVYFSFTDILVKTTTEGEIIGSVTGLVGHMGCIAYNPLDRRLYASVEYKADSIGRAISQRLGVQTVQEDGFYVAIFDVDKIDRLGMDAERDGLMTCVYLEEVLQDYKAQWEEDGEPKKHRYGCSGIDGITFAPAPGENPAGQYLYIAYGIYGDEARADNDHQVLLRYDTADWRRYERPLSQGKMHRSGPAKPEEKLFVYTGNTTYGIQNLEYDPYTGCLLAAVYRGKKPAFANFSLFAIDLAQSPCRQPLRGHAEEGMVARLWEKGMYHAPSGTYGWESELGSTGLISLGDGAYYLSRPKEEEEGIHSSRLQLHRWRGGIPNPFEWAP